MQALVRDCNRAYAAERALHDRDCEAEGFRWIVVDDADNSVFAWLRFAGDGARPVAAIANFTPVPRPGYRIGLPAPGRWREILNTDGAVYGGSNCGNRGQRRRGRRRPAMAFPLRPKSCCRRSEPFGWCTKAAHDLAIRSSGGKEGERSIMDKVTSSTEKVTYSTPLARSAMAYVLAGGRGSRLMELTERRAKPAVYFGGKSRIIDFALSNALNSGIRRIAVATQYKAHSLIRHLQRGWNFLQPVRNESFDILPASQRVAEDQWYAGTADAVFQNIDIIDGYAPEYIIILAGDHIYKMDYERMLVQHVNAGADVTVACLEVPVAEATGFGVMHVDATGRIVSFVEKPPEPPEMPDRPGWALASMGIYVFNREFLHEQLRRDAADQTSSRDFGRDIIPWIVTNGKAIAHRFAESCVQSRAEGGVYWRDVGTLDAYWEANIDLTDIVPALDLYDRDWPIWTYAEITPPAKFVHDVDGRRGVGISSLVSGGCIVSGAGIKRSLLFTGVRVNSYSNIENTVVLPYVEIGRRVKLANAIIDAGVKIPAGLEVGVDPEVDARRFRRTERGVCLITQPMIDRLGQALVLDATPARPRGRVGDLSVDQDRRPRRRRRRAAARARARRHHDAHADSRVCAGARRVEGRHGDPHVRAIARRARPPPRRARRGTRPLRARRASSLRAPRQHLCRNRRERMARQRASLRGARRLRRRDRPRRRRRLRTRHRPRPRLAGRPRSGAAPLRRRTAAGHDHDGAQPVVSGPVSARAPRADRPASPRLCTRRRRIPRHDRLPQGGARVGRPDHHRVADLRRRDPHARGRDGARRPVAQAGGRIDRHPQRDRRRGVESGDGSASRRALRRETHRATFRQQDGAAGGLSASSATRRRSCSASSAA